MTDISEDAIEDVKDDLESVTEQVKSPTPKKSRLQKGYDSRTTCKIFIKVCNEV